MIPYGSNQTNEQQQHITQYFFGQSEHPIMDTDFLDKIDIDQESHNDWINQTHILNDQKQLSILKIASRQYSNALNYDQKENSILSSNNRQYQDINLFQDNCLFQESNQYQVLQLQKSSSSIKQITNLNLQKNTKNNFYSDSIIDKKSIFKKLKQQIDDSIQKLIQKYSLIDQNIDFKFIHLSKSNDLRENIIQELIQIFSVDLMQFNPSTNSNSEKYKNKTFWCKCGSKYANYHGIKYHISHQHQVTNGVQVPTWIWQVKIRSSFGRPKCKKEEETNQ